LNGENNLDMIASLLNVCTLIVDMIRSANLNHGIAAGERVERVCNRAAPGDPEQLGWFNESTRTTGWKQA
jgi:hypothetical protein